MEFFERLNLIIEENKLTNYRIAKDLNLSPSTVTNWRDGINEPKAKQIKILCNYFDVSADYLLGISDIF